jgi:methanol---5-hydroxybenzimidazolylcobamide Co-methyltransferase
MFYIGGIIMIKKYEKLAYEDLDDFIFGSARHPVILKNGLSIGGGKVYPEIKFTLPPMLIDSSTFQEVRSQYSSMTEDVLKRARELHVSGLITEIELLPPMTYDPVWGIEIIKIVKDILNRFESESGILTGLRATPVDIREDRHSKHMWHGEFFDKVMIVFEGSAKAGADLLAIESIGGKDVHDDALMYCEIDKSLFALSILGAADMHKLWTSISEIAAMNGSIPSGDTACGFANTAMVLSDMGYIPRVLAALIRVMSGARSLVAVEAGAKGPHKDCGYEGVYVKAITGIPISMEGKSSACAHLSPIGNISASAADLWSNESVQNIKLLAGMAPTVSMEQLIYDCRLQNAATDAGHKTALMLRDLLTESDSSLDPQAYVLRPDFVIDISREIIKHDSCYDRARFAALKTINILRDARADHKVDIPDREIPWLDKFEDVLSGLPDDTEEFTKKMVDECTSDKFDPKKYDL